MPEPGALFWTPVQGVNKLTSREKAGSAFALFSMTAAEQFIHSHLLLVAFAYGYFPNSPFSISNAHCAALFGVHT